VRVAADPFVVSICNCSACQRRTGSAFGLQAAFKADEVEIEGRYNDFARVSEETDRKLHVFHFCPDCGSQVFYTEPDEPDLVVVSGGSFADPSFPWPTESGYDSKRYPWVRLPESVSRFAPELWDPVRPLYAERRYAEAADLGRELIETHGENPHLLYNLACVESLAGRKLDSIEHLRRGIQMFDALREMAAHDLDFDPVRDEPGFQALL
jgi:hypothetical protein